MVRAWGTAPAEGLQVSLAVETGPLTATAFAKTLIAAASASPARLYRRTGLLGDGDFAAERAQKVELHPPI